MLMASSAHAAGWTPGAWPSYDHTRQSEAWQRDVWSGIVERAELLGIETNTLQMYWSPTSTPHLYRSERDNLVSAKVDVVRLLTNFIDGRLLAGTVALTNLPPYWSVTGLAAAVRMPTNYFWYTPYRGLSGCGQFTNDPTVGHPHGYPVTALEGFPLTVCLTGFVFNTDTSYPTVNGCYALESGDGTGYTMYTNTDPASPWILDNDFFVSLEDGWNLYDTVGGFGWYILPQSTEHQPIVGPVGSWEAIQTNDVPGASYATARQPSIDQAGTNYPSGRTNWYTTDYGWAQMSNVFSWLRYTYAVSNGVAAYSGAYGTAYGYLALTDGDERFEDDGVPAQQARLDTYLRFNTWQSTGVWTRNDQAQLGVWQKTFAVDVVQSNTGAGTWNPLVLSYRRSDTYPSTIFYHEWDVWVSNTPASVPSFPVLGTTGEVLFATTNIDNANHNPATLNFLGGDYVKMADFPVTTEYSFDMAGDAYLTAKGATVTSGQHRVFDLPMIPPQLFLTNPGGTPRWDIGDNENVISNKADRTYTAPQDYWAIRKDAYGGSIYSASLLTNRTARHMILWRAESPPTATGAGTNHVFDGFGVMTATGVYQLVYEETKAGNILWTNPVTWANSPPYDDDFSISKGFKVNSQAAILDWFTTDGLKYR